jgi:hydrogenase expression/formation protein HypE
MIINSADIVADDVALRVCDLFGMEPMSSISEGTLVGTVRSDHVADVLRALDDAGIPASDVGELVPNDRGVRVVEDGVETELVHPGTDPFWGTFEEYLGKQAERKQT